MLDVFIAVEILIAAGTVGLVAWFCGVQYEAKRAANRWATQMEVAALEIKRLTMVEEHLRAVLDTKERRNLQLTTDCEQLRMRLARLSSVLDGGEDAT